MHDLRLVQLCLQLVAQITRHQHHWGATSGLERRGQEQHQQDQEATREQRRAAGAGAEPHGARPPL